MGVEVLGEFDRFRAHRGPVVAAVGVVLHVGDVRPVAFQEFHRLQRGAVVARRAQVVTVQVQRMGQTEFVHDPGECRDDLPRRHRLEAGDRIMQALGVLAPLPGRYPAGVDRLDAVRLGRPDVPGDDVPGAFELAGLDLIEQQLVVRHEHAAGLIDDGRVAQFFVRVPGRQHGNGRFIHGRITEAGVKIAGNEGRGRGPADAAARHERAHEFLVPAVVLRDHRAGKVERGPRDMRMHIDAAGKHHHARRVDGATALNVGDDAAVVDANVLNDAVDVVGWVVDFSASDSQHGFGLILERSHADRARGGTAGTA